jgi:hypothetical protein
VKFSSVAKEDKFFASQFFVVFFLLLAVGAADENYSDDFDVGQHEQPAVAGAVQRSARRSYSTRRNRVGPAHRRLHNNEDMRTTSTRYIYSMQSKLHLYVKANQTFDTHETRKWNTLHESSSMKMSNECQFSINTWSYSHNVMTSCVAARCATTQSLSFEKGSYYIVLLRRVAWPSRPFYGTLYYCSSSWLILGIMV